jgi:hypothetical protein
MLNAGGTIAIEPVFIAARFINSGLRKLRSTSESP